MSKKLNDDEDVFLSFLIKEKEIAYIKEIHARTAIRYMGKVFQEKQEKATILDKTFWYIKDFFRLFYLKFIHYKNQQQIKDLTDDDKKEKEIVHKQYKQGNFKIHFFLVRRFQIKTLVDDSGCVDISNFEYDAYLRIEFSELFSQQCLKKTFNNENDANNYFNLILLDNKKKNAVTLIKELSDKTDEEYNFLKEKCDFLEKKLLHE